MSGNLAPGLGELAKLPLELRYMIYEFLDEDFCCHISEPLSLFRSYRHDPCVPLGVSRVSKTIWGEVQQLFYQRTNRDLRIRIGYDGWKATCHALGFRSDWSSPSLASFQRLILEISAPAEDDPGQALLTIRNISNFVTVLNAAPSLPPTMICFVDPTNNTTASWECKQFHRFAFFPSFFGPPFHTLAYNVRNPLYYMSACALLPLQRPPSSSVHLPEYLGVRQRDDMNPLLTHWPHFPNPEFPHTSTHFGSHSSSDPHFTTAAAAAAAKSPTRLHLLLTINALGLSKTLDDLPGPTAARLRASRRRNWPAYAAWLAGIRAQLRQCRPGIAFLSTELEPGYSWRDEVAMMDDRARRRCEETRDADWWAEKRWLREDEGPRGSVVTGACGCGGCVEEMESAAARGEVVYTVSEKAAERLLRGWERSWWKEKGE